MSNKLFVCALALWLAACSRTGPAQSPAQADKAQPPSQASTPPSAAPQTGKPDV